MARLTSTTALFILPTIFGLLLHLCIADNVLYSGGTFKASSLARGQFLSWGDYYFPMQLDCNLVLYDRGNPVWASGTSGKGSGCYLLLQDDGNLVINSNNDVRIWASNTGGRTGNFVLILQPDRNVVIYGGALWATGTNVVDVGVTITKNSTSEALSVVGGASDQNIAMVTN